MMPEECFGRITGLEKLRGVSLSWHQTPARLAVAAALFVCLRETNGFIPNMSCMLALDVDESGCPRNEGVVDRIFVSRRKQLDSPASFM
jgi:hypothetical protein